MVARAGPEAEPLLEQLIPCSESALFLPSAVPLTREPAFNALVDTSPAED